MSRVFQKIEYFISQFIFLLTNAPTQFYRTRFSRHPFARVLPEQQFHDVVFCLLRRDEQILPRMHKTCAFTLRRLPGDVALQICASRTSDPSAFCFSCSSSKRKKKYGVFVMACFMLNAFLTGEDFHFDEASRITDPP